MSESITRNPTVGQRGEKVFRGFIRSSDEEWLCVSPSRSGDRYLAIPNGSVIEVDAPADDGPATISIDVSTIVYKVTERAVPATEIEPWNSDEPGVQHMKTNPFNQLALLLKLKAAGGSLTIGDVDEDTLDTIISLLEEWRKQWGRRWE